MFREAINEMTVFYYMHFVGGEINIGAFIHVWEFKIHNIISSTTTKKRENMFIQFKTKT